MEQADAPSKPKASPMWPVRMNVRLLREFLRQVPGGVRYFGVSPDPDVLAASAVQYQVFRVEATALSPAS